MQRHLIFQTQIFMILDTDIYIMATLAETDIIGQIRPAAQTAVITSEQVDILITKDMTASTPSVGTQKQSVV